MARFVIEGHRFEVPNRYRHFTRVEILRKLARRGLRGVKLVISDAHEGIKAAIAKVLHATWQRCRVHFMRNVLAHAGREFDLHQRRAVNHQKPAARPRCEFAGAAWHQIPSYLSETFNAQAARKPQFR